MSDKAQEIQKALKHHQRSEDKAAIAILESAHLEDDADALLLLGRIYFSAEKSKTGVSLSLAKARKCWQRSDAQGNSEASRELADLYNLGIGVKVDFERAESYWRKAADAGDEVAMFDLANYYYDHQDDKIELTIDLCRRLIDRGEFVGNCCLLMGRIYSRGKGVPRDPGKAITWLERGAALGHGNSCMDLAMMYYRGEGGAKDVARAIQLVETAGKEKLFSDEAPVIVKAMRDGTLLQ